MRALRRGKAEAALLIALADIGGVWPVERVTRALTEFADAALGAAVRYLLRGAAASGKLKPADAAKPEQGSGYVVLAMGKMGAFELNYSSDIDLIVLYDEDAPALAEGVEPGALFVRLTRNLVKLMQERTADGYVFRTDLRLRPDPASTQIAISIASALNYYESTGQNWERAAMIKARACAGDIAVGETFLKEVAPFVWRKYLDYGAVADVHAMKRQMAAYKGHDEIAIEGHNIKLGRGGIREIEFFVQTQQLIAGGRHRELRGRQTLITLEDLAKGGWISRDAARDLAEAYRFLRVIEHRLQMVADEQTHTLPDEREALERFARFLGYESRDAFAAVLLEHLRKVQRHYARLFEDAPAAEASRRALRFPPDKDDTETLDKLAAMGFRRPLEVSQAVRRWLAGEYRSLKGEFARSHLAELVPVLIDQLARSENPDQALVALDRFLAGLHGGARLLSLLRRNPDFVALLALALGNAPRLADILARYPHVMDALIEPSFFGALPDADKLAAELSGSLAQALSYEDLLDRARQFGQEHMFLIGARILSGTVSAEQAGEAFARLADVIIRAVHRAVEDNFIAAHGRMKGQQSAVLALGKLGGREMTAASDLDLIIVYDFDEEHPQSDGPRPLYGGQYFARVTQRLVSALAAPTNYGALYNVDMRLRPVGPLGPGRDDDRLVRELSGKRGLDLGASGAHARAGRLRLAGLRGARGESDPGCAVPPARCRNDRRRCGRNAHRDRHGKRRQRALEFEICRGRADRPRIHRAIPAAGARRREAGNPRYLDRTRARQGRAAWRADAGRRRRAAPGRAALPEPDADPAAVPLGSVRSEIGGAGTAQSAGARRRRSGFHHARSAPHRDAGARARELRADLGEGALARLAQFLGRTASSPRRPPAAAPSRSCRRQAMSGCASRRRAVRPAILRSRARVPNR